MNDITLESLVGEHELSGVDMSVESNGYEDASVCRFVLDGKAYTATEDPDDGYRSYLGTLQEGGEVKNSFPAQRVLCYMRGGSDETLVFRDVVTGKEVLEVGTDNTDDYYPSFVAHFQPQNMAINVKEPA